MRRIILKSKIHRATVTAASVDYEGSITIDRALMDAADIFTHEQVHVLDIDNGARLVTYAIPGESGEICVNGAAAKKINVGDTVIIISYGGLVPNEWPGHEPRIVLVGQGNAIVRVDGPEKAPATEKSAGHHSEHPGHHSQHPGHHSKHPGHHSKQPKGE